MEKFLTDLFLAAGSFAVATGVSEFARSQFPAWYRVVVPVLIVGATAALTGFDVVSPGWIAGGVVSVGGARWFLRNKKVTNRG